MHVAWEERSFGIKLSGFAYVQGIVLVCHESVQLIPLAYPVGAFGMYTGNKNDKSLCEQIVRDVETPKVSRQFGAEDISMLMKFPVLQISKLSS